MSSYLYHVSELVQTAKTKSKTLSVCGISDKLDQAFEAMMFNIDEEQWPALITDFISKHVDTFIETGEYEFSYTKHNPNVPSDPVIKTTIRIIWLIKDRIPLEQKLQNEIAA
jgi:hypothetical protein